MTKDLKSKVNREANRLGQQLAKEIAAIAMRQVELNEYEPMLVQVTWDPVNQNFVSQYLEKDKF